MQRNGGYDVSYSYTRTYIHSYGVVIIFLTPLIILPKKAPKISVSRKDVRKLISFLDLNVEFAANFSRVVGELEPH